MLTEAYSVIPSLHLSSGDSSGSFPRNCHSGATLLVSGRGREHSRPQGLPRAPFGLRQGSRTSRKILSNGLSNDLSLSNCLWFYQGPQGPLGFNMHILDITLCWIPCFWREIAWWPALEQNKQRQQKSKANLLMAKKSSKELTWLSFWCKGKSSI